MTFSNIIKVSYRLIANIISNPTSIFLILEDETYYKKAIFKKYGIEKLHTVDINNFLQNRKASIENYTYLDGSSLVTDLALLKSLAASFEACEYLEIGTWRGESLVNVASVAHRCTSINLSPEDIIQIFKNPEYAAQHGCLITDNSNITNIYANSQTFDFSTLNKKFDLVFVDADHSYEAVKNDTANVFKLLKDENSIIVWHDCGFNSELPRYSVIKAILDGSPTEFHKHIYHVSNTMCGIFTLKNLESYLIQSPHRPDKVFSINFENKDI